MVDTVENTPGVLEPKQQRADTALLERRKQMVGASDGAGALPEPFGSQYFPTNRTDKLFACSVSRAAKETTQNCWRRFGRYCCCHVR
jgi:hypothetical protein